MNIFRRLLGLERRSSVQTAHPRDPVLAEWFGGGATASGVQVSEESAIGIAAVYACVRILARTLATTPLHLYRRLPDGDRERADDHPLAVLLREAPNHWQTGYEFREMLMGHLALRGNGYAEIIKDNAENVLELIPLSPATVTPRWTTNGQEIEYAVADDKRRVLPAERVLHLRGLSGDLLRGLSPITVHRETLGEHAAAQAYSARFFGNGAQPKGGLKVPGALTPEQTKQFMEAWDSRHRGADRSNRPALLHSGLEWVQIGMSHDDAQFVETRTLTRRDIFSIFGIPPHKAGDLERSTFSNIEHQSIEFVTDAIEPWTRAWEQRLKRALMPPEMRTRYFLEFDLKGLLRGDTAARSAFYRELFGIGALSANDVRRAENLKPIDGGDQYFVPLNMAPADKVMDILLRDQGGESDPPMRTLPPRTNGATHHGH